MRFIYKVIFSLFCLLFCVKCKKSDYLQNRNIDYTLESRFFNVSDTANPVIIRIIEKVKRDNREEYFVDKFSAKNGFPIWDKSIVLQSDKFSVPNRLSNSNSIDTFAYIPLVLDMDNKVNGFILAKINGDIEMLYTLAKDYKGYSYESSSSMLSDASKFVLTVLQLNESVFGVKEYNVTDFGLFTEDSVHERVSKITLGGRLFGASCESVVWTTQYCGTPNYCRARGECDNCQTYCWLVANTIELCTATTIMWPQGGIGGVGGSSGGSGGTSGGGPIPYYYPCVSQPTPLLPENPAPPCPEPGPGTGWNYIPVSVQSVTNNITNVCLMEVYNKITADKLKSDLARMLSSFAQNQNINVTFKNVSNLSTGTLAVCSDLGSNNYLIELDENVLPKNSQEKIACIMFHEVIHAYLFYHRDEYDFSTTNSHHTQMAANYMNKMFRALTEIFPNLSRKQALCLFYGTVYGTEEFDPIDQVVTDQILTIVSSNIRREFPELSNDVDILDVSMTFNNTGTAGTRSLNPACN